MEILKKVLIGVAVIVALFFVVAAFLSSEYRVERSVVVNTSPDVVYPFVAELEQWRDWSPWAEMEPTAKYTFTGVPGEAGSKWSWKGEIVGEGSLQHDELVKNKSIKSSLKFVSPQPMTSVEEWSFEPTDGGTKVVWIDEGELGYPMGRYFGLFLDDMLGTDFEKGLAKLKSLAEAKAAEIAKEAEEVKEEAPIETVE
ncbi:MAG: hypothetical protein SCALA702_38000 [Melioribacteraceae bacterium]|nr:MAG: hypothetical protein SCALA702_38000 [Melioribacteraceae bacterium]